MLQLAEFEKIKGELSRKRLDGSKGGFHRIPKFMMTKKQREIADREDYEYNMAYLFDFIAVRYFKVRECYVPKFMKARIMKRLIVDNIDVGDFVRKVEIIQRNEPFHAYLEECEDETLLYTIQGKSFIYTLNIDFGLCGVIDNPINGTVQSWEPIKLHEILRREDGDNFENYYEV